MKQLKIFISHSKNKEDTRQANVLMQALILQNVQAFSFKITPIYPTADFYREITDKIAGADLVAVLWSRSACASEWIKYEIEIAQKAGKRILPILLDEIELPTTLSRIQAIQAFDNEDIWVIQVMHFIRSEKMVDVRSKPPVEEPTSNFGKAFKVGLLATAVYSWFKSDDNREESKTSKIQIKRRRKN